MKNMTEEFIQQWEHGSVPKTRLIVDNNLRFVKNPLFPLLIVRPSRKNDLYPSILISSIEQKFHDPIMEYHTKNILTSISFQMMAGCDGLYRALTAYMNRYARLMFTYVDNDKLNIEIICDNYKSVTQYKMKQIKGQLVELK